MGERVAIFSGGDKEAIAAYQAEQARQMALLIAGYAGKTIYIK